MSKNTRVLLISFLAVACGLAWEAQAGDKKTGFHDNRPATDTIVSGVIDLLDRPVVLDTAAGTAVWRSEPFDTSRFTRIGLRASSESTDGAICCSAAWQFTRDDEFLEGMPSTCSSTLDINHYLGDDRTRIQYVRPLGPVGPSMSEVCGLRATVVCRIFPLTGPDVGDVEDPPQAQASGRLTDVKVLLRVM